MSGRKRSSYSLRRQHRRAEKQRRLQRLKAAHAEAERLRDRVASSLAQASEGLRATFADDVAQATEWLDGLDLPRVDRLSMWTGATKLGAAEADLNRAVARGRDVQTALTLCLNQKADEVGQQLAARLAEAQNLYAGLKAPLELWCAPAQVAQWDRGLEDAERLLVEEQYGELDPALSRLEAEIRENGSSAQQKEEKYQNREYLLKAVRQVCEDMGFDEVGEPQWEQPGERGSRIRLDVDTHDRGTITFVLSLDEITSCSEMWDDHCIEEFGQLSYKLEEHYGIANEFTMPNGDPVPKLIRKGEKREPDDSGKQAETQASGPS